jgi:hypothetical protein
MRVPFEIVRGAEVQEACGQPLEELVCLPAGSGLH